MKIIVTRNATAYDKDFAKGEQEVSEYYAQPLINAGVAILVEEVKEKAKEVKKSKLKK